MPPSILPSSSLHSSGVRGVARAACFSCAGVQSMCSDSFEPSTTLCSDSFEPSITLCSDSFEPSAVLQCCGLILSRRVCNVWPTAAEGPSSEYGCFGATESWADINPGPPKLQALYELTGTKPDEMMRWASSAGRKRALDMA